MRWLVEIIDIVADQRFLADVLARLNIALYREDNRIYLTSNQFELLSKSTEVWNLAEQIRTVVSEVSNGFPDTSISFNLGEIHKQRENGSRSRYFFASGTVAASLSIGLTGTGIVTYTEISEEERDRLEAERLELEYQNKLALFLSRVVPASRDNHALEVHRLLQQELNPLRMGHIVDLIEADCGGREGLKNFISSSMSIQDKNLVDRFYYSINSSEAFGHDSRHIVNKHKSRSEKKSKNKPLPNPMSLSEAQVFVSRVADSWFERKCVEDNNV